jgi:hypothetical protein
MEDPQMKHSTATAKSFFLGVFWSPIERIDSAKIVALFGAFFQYLLTDAFAGAFFLVFVAGSLDFVIGVRAAKITNTFETARAHLGALGKMTGWALLWLIYALEFYVRAQGGPDLHGALATGAALSLLVVDLQSIAHHREELGGKPIPFLDDVFAWVQRFAMRKLPPDSAAKP